MTLQLCISVLVKIVTLFKALLIFYSVISWYKFCHIDYKCIKEMFICLTVGI